MPVSYNTGEDPGVPEWGLSDTGPCPPPPEIYPDLDNQWQLEEVKRLRIIITLSGIVAHFAG